MHPPYFENPPPYGRLIQLPKGRPHYQVHELIEYGDEIIRNPIGRAWEQGRIIMELPDAIYELVPLDGMHGFQSPNRTPTPGRAEQSPQQSSVFTH